MADNVSFDVLIDKIRPAVFAVGDDKKKSWVGLGREGTQSHKTLYFGYLWGGHPWADSHKIWHACCPRNVINTSNFGNEIFRDFRSKGA